MAVEAEYLKTINIMKGFKKQYSRGTRLYLRCCRTGNRVISLNPRRVLFFVVDDDLSIL